MNDQEMKSIKDSSTKTFYAMAKYLYITGVRIYKEQGDHELVASIMLDNNRTESYLAHVKDYLAKRFDGHMEEAGKRERLIYVDMDKVMLEMKNVHIKALLFSMS
ncbi:MAG: hypothetical protein E7C46_17475 [Klebsiella grimontii]|uniref:Uncharacterized protein n=1 Tax=Raoultella terrigena TaxID=577 RepID=A0A3P8M170_RAOTE|nr:MULTISPECIES: hypothetical protein [Enterobacterales]MBS0928845.1 hypothetical protein [Klebsiella michiganensis]MDU2706835.1 hypothetical protein [Klebsiella grimontii]CAI1687348.1 Uncharacterised protein [Serratia grimesii]VDR25846.1 Uncharacterised protein [Raoultella terrigena]